MPHPQRWIAWADAVTNGGRNFGISSSSGHSYHFRKVLSLGFVETALCQPGTPITIEPVGHPHSPRKAIRATAAPVLYKFDNRRCDLPTIVEVHDRTS